MPEQATRRFVLAAGAAKRGRRVVALLAVASLLAPLAGCDDDKKKEKEVIHQSFESECGDTAFSYTGDATASIRITVKSKRTSTCNITVTVSGGGRALGAAEIKHGASATLQRKGVDSVTIHCDGAAGGTCEGNFSVEFL